MVSREIDSTVVQKCRNRTLIVLPEYLVGSIHRDRINSLDLDAALNTLGLTVLKTPRCRFEILRSLEIRLIP